MRRVQTKKRIVQTMNGGADNDADKGLLWKLPVIKTSQFGKIGPAFGVGAGCGFGFGLGLLGGFPFFAFNFFFCLISVIVDLMLKFFDKFNLNA